MRERLAIKTDQVEDWYKGKVRSAFKNLTPRDVDNGFKSSWAHRAGDDAHPASLDDPSGATCILQALALFMFAELASSEARAVRNRVSGVSLHREVIRPDLVIEDEAEHPVPAYASTHRSLAMGDPAVREATATVFLEARAFDGWEYTRHEMAQALRALLETGHISSSMRDGAEQLLHRWTDWDRGGGGRAGAGGGRRGGAGAAGRGGGSGRVRPALGTTDLGAGYVAGLRLAHWEA